MKAEDYIGEGCSVPYWTLMKPQLRIVPADFRATVVLAPITASWEIEGSWVQAEGAEGTGAAVTSIQGRRE